MPNHLSPYQTPIPHIQTIVKPSYPAYGPCIIYQTLVFVKFKLTQFAMTKYEIFGEF